jgi:hypothetical protein
VIRRIPLLRPETLSINYPSMYRIVAMRVVLGTNMD